MEMVVVAVCQAGGGMMRGGRERRTRDWEKEGKKVPATFNKESIAIVLAYFKK
jgi:uncharacterized membrane protein